MRHPRVLMHTLFPLTPGAASLLEDLLPDFVIDDAAEQRAQEIRRGDGGGHVVVAPAAIASEAWPPSRFAALVSWLLQRYEVTVTLAGGPGDTALLRTIRDSVQAPAATVDAAVRLVQEPLPVFAALLRRSQLLISNDSAPIHFADVFGVPTLYFSRQHYVPHSHPVRSSAWALYDESQNRVAQITVEQAARAVEHMVAKGVTTLPERSA
jgi:ADP-heptose:LPS heptosyltransferase